MEKEGGGGMTFAAAVAPSPSQTPASGFSLTVELNSPRPGFFKLSLLAFILLLSTAFLLAAGVTLGLVFACRACRARKHASSSSNNSGRADLRNSHREEEPAYALGSRRN